MFQVTSTCHHGSIQGVFQATSARCFYSLALEHAKLVERSLEHAKLVERCCFPHSCCVKWLKGAARAQARPYPDKLYIYIFYVIIDKYTYTYALVTTHMSEDMYVVRRRQWQGNGGTGRHTHTWHTWAREHASKSPLLTRGDKSSC